MPLCGPLRRRGRALEARTQNHDVVDPGGAVGVRLERRRVEHARYWARQAVDRAHRVDAAQRPRDDPLTLGTQPDPDAAEIYVTVLVVFMDLKADRAPRLRGVGDRQLGQFRFTRCLPHGLNMIAARTATPPAPRAKRRYWMSARARVNTASSIGSVSRPVNVFC